MWDSLREASATVDGSSGSDRAVTINQGGKTVRNQAERRSAQPLTQLLTRIKPANDAAQADVRASRADAQETQNEVALKVHEIYYQILVTQLHRSATCGQNPGQSRLKANASSR